MGIQTPQTDPQEHPVDKIIFLAIAEHLFTEYIGLHSIKAFFRSLIVQGITLQDITDFCERHQKPPVFMFF